MLRITIRKVNVYWSIDVKGYAAIIWHLYSIARGLNASQIETLNLEIITMSFEIRYVRHYSTNVNRIIAHNYVRISILFFQW